MLKAVKDTAQKEKTEEKKEAKDAGSTSKSRSTHYDASLPMSISEIDAIRSQIAKCWNVPAGAKDAQNLVVVLRLDLAEDGSVIKLNWRSESKSRYDSETVFSAPPPTVPCAPWSSAARLKTCRRTNTPPGAIWN